MRTTGIRRFWTFTCAALACGAGLAGCASSGGGGGWSPRLAQTRTAEMDLDAWSSMGYRLLWTGSAVMDRGGSVERFDLFDGSALVQESGNTVTLMELESGRNRWSTRLGDRLTRFVGNASADDRVLVCSDHEVYVLSAETGDLVDRQGLDLVVNTPPVVTGGAAVFGTTGGRVLAHDLRTGLGRWQYQLRGSIDAPPALAGENAVVVSERGDVIALRPGAGTATGRAKIFDGLDNAPVASESVMYMASRDQSLYAFEVNGGERLWRLRTQDPLTAQPTLHADRLYVTIPEWGLTALDAFTGDRIWSAGGVEGRVAASRGGRLLVWDGSGVTVLDGATGDRLSRHELPGVEILTASAFEDGDLYAVTAGGAVSRFVPR